MIVQTLTFHAQRAFISDREMKDPHGNFNAKLMLKPGRADDARRSFEADAEQIIAEAGWDEMTF